jgi:hypothetical protein
LQAEKRKTINGEDILFAMSTLGFDNYVEPLKLYLQKYREAMKGDKHAEGDFDGIGDELLGTATAAAAAATPQSAQSGTPFSLEPPGHHGRGHRHRRVRQPSPLDLHQLPAVCSTQLASPSNSITCGTINKMEESDLTVTLDYKFFTKRTESGQTIYSTLFKEFPNLKVQNVVYKTSTMIDLLEKSQPDNSLVSLATPFTWRQSGTGLAVASSPSCPDFSRASGTSKLLTRTDRRCPLGQGPSA